MLQPRKQLFSLIVTTLAFFSSVAALAAQPQPELSLPVQPILNKVSYELTSETWAKTNTVLVNVGIDAAFSEAKLEQIRADILQKLARLTPGADWHITNFARSQDGSGLERLQMQAQARVNNNTVGNLRQQAKTISKPGETFTIVQLDYSPSPAEIEAARLALHKQIYLQAKSELNELNQLYSGQKYYLHSIDFSPQVAVVEPQLMLRMNALATSKGDATTAMPVDDKVILTAKVILAATAAVVNQD